MNPLKQLKQFHDKNKQYDGFVRMEVFTAITLLSLVINFCSLTRDPLDWAITVLWYEASLVFAMEWCCNREYKDHADFMKEILASDNKAMMGLCEQLTTEHARLVSANRRRKRAERQLKWYRHALCAESATHLGILLENEELKKASSANLSV